MILTKHNFPISHDEIYGLNETYKQQDKDRSDVIDLLTHEIEQKNRTMLELRSKIETLEKQNEKKHNEAVTKYEGQIKEIKKKGEEKMSDNTTKM